MTACKWEYKMLQLLQQQLLLLLQDCRQLVITQQKNKTKKTCGYAHWAWYEDWSWIEEGDCWGGGHKQAYLFTDSQRFGRWTAAGLAVDTLPPSWMARSSPAEADADASSWLAASRCAELSAAPMTNNHTNELFLPWGKKKKGRHNSLPGRPQDYFVFFYMFSIHRVQVWSLAAQLRPGVAWIRSDEEWGPSNSFQDSVGWLPSVITWLLGFLHHRLCWLRSFAQKLESFQEFGEEMTTKASLSWISKQEKKIIVKTLSLILHINESDKTKRGFGHEAEKHTSI